GKKAQLKSAIKTERSQKAIKALKYILVIAQAAASILFVFSLLSLGIIDIKISLLLIVTLIGLEALTVIKLIKKSTTPLSTQIICALISLATIIASFVAFRYTDAANAFLSKITSGDTETKEYSVLTLQKSDYNNIEDLKSQKIGLMKIDPNATKAEETLQQTINFEPIFYDGVDELTSNLQKSRIHAVVLESDRYRALEEDEHELTKDTKIIYTFTIDLKKETEAPNIDIAKEPFTVLISGSDSRTGVKTTARSDVNIVAAVNPKEGKILLVSIPRDAYVQLHGTTGLKDKLTHAGIYGINMSKQTIEDLLGIKIDYTLKVSFDTVVKVVDQLDGIEIDSDQAMRLPVEGKPKYCTYTVGKQTVDGDCALRFARERKSYKTGDRHRGENQQQVIASIITKLSKDKSYVMKLPEILEIAGDSFETSIPRDNITALIRLQLNEGKTWTTENSNIDGTGSMQPTYSMGANLPLYVMYPNQETIDKAHQKLLEYLEITE
ncbi:LCP family protein, partial [Candidatus Saccharibacteria bacterium]|nr:LCP family protein [Candidatus Saccharibacteria bacterium]